MSSAARNRPALAHFEAYGADSGAAAVDATETEDLKSPALYAETINDENTEFDLIKYNWTGQSTIRNVQYVKAYLLIQLSQDNRYM